MLVLTFQVGNDRLALDIRRLREVVPRVQLQRAAGSPDWLAGVFIYRGRIIPVLDLHRLLGADECPPLLSSRILLVPLSSPRGESTEEKLVGLLAAGVAEIRDLVPGESLLPPLNAPGEPNLGQTLADRGEILHLIDLDRFLPAAVEDQLAIVPHELRHEP